MATERSSLKSSKLIYLNHLPKANEIAEHPIFIYDKYLLKVPKVKKWIQSLPYTYPVTAGETLKQLKSFERHTINILKIYEQMKVKNITFVAIGGGSVGDFVGFLASVFKRGVSLVHIPSTWLAAIDSSHGGKTALNLGNYKNQIGSFYSAEKIILCKELLFTQPAERVHDALGEVLKTSLLAGGPLWKNISKESQFDSQKLWTYLPSLINYKYKIVKKDPFEKKGLRYVLNLGHTIGHTFEINYQLPHGYAVNLGLRMALELSYKKNLLTKSVYDYLLEAPLLKVCLANQNDLKPYLKNISKIKQALYHDKKISKNNKINFIFLRSPGKPIVKEVDISWLLEQLRKF